MRNLVLDKNKLMKALIFSIFLLGSLSFGNTFKPETVSDQTENQGEKTFKKYCASCHTGGFKSWLTGAPNISDREEWKSSLDKEIPDLVNIIFTGADDHKLKGGCKKCTEEQIKQAIEHIMQKIKE